MSYVRLEFISLQFHYTFFCFFFFFNDTATTEIYTLSLHDALPISGAAGRLRPRTEIQPRPAHAGAHGPLRLRNLGHQRSEEHTSELQSRLHLVCRLLLEKKKKNKQKSYYKTT